jgi:hypothetical protein
MSVDDPGQRNGAGHEGTPRAAGGGADVMSLVPPPPNARADGLDGRASGLAAFVVSQVDVAAPSKAAAAGGASVAVQILRATRARQARRRTARRGAGVAVALAAAGFVAWTAATRPPATLSYTVDGAAPPPGGIVESSPGHEPELAFSDGTNIRVLPSARARVLEVGRRGARVMLEEGRAHVHVVHRPGADWQVQAGAFLIRVHGTAFFVEWKAAESRLELQMESGVVSVEGPRAGDTVTVRGGESLSLGLDGPRMGATPAELPRAPREPASPPAPAPHPLEAPPRPSSSTAPAARWSERLADGDAAGILAEAQRRGLTSVLAGASSEDLAALADAARFRNQDRLARRVMLAQRRRFAGTLRAEEASFLLGRLADGPGGRPSDALDWYDRYLREAPSGSYAAEAMGRMMLVLERQQRTDQARAVAAAYLRRFPHGAYARAARALASPDEP